MDYTIKYLKYKNKYLKLKEQYGASNDSDKAADEMVINIETVVKDDKYKNLRKITLGENVKVIGSKAFYSGKLEEVIFGKNIEKIDVDAFISNKLTKIIIPPSVTYR